MVKEKAVERQQRQKVGNRGANKGINMDCQKEENVIFVVPSKKGNLPSSYLNVGQDLLSHPVQMPAPILPCNHLPTVPPSSSFSYLCFLPVPNLGSHVLGAILSSGSKGSASAASSLKAERGDHLPDFSSKSRLGVQEVCSASLRVVSSMSPLLCPPEQRDACSQWEGGRASTYGGNKPGESSGPSLEGRSWGNRKEWKAVSRSVMAVIIYLFMYFLLRRRCRSNEQGALLALRGGPGGNGALSTHKGSLSSGQGPPLATLSPQ